VSNGTYRNPRAGLAGGGYARVIDGDTIEINQQRIRRHRRT
jgi:endonuclease YncB( thermonuclease family)